MEADIPPGSYNFKVDVEDRVRTEKATGTVTVNIYNLPQVAFDNQAAIRISMDANGYEDSSVFLSDHEGSGSPKDKFVTLLKRKITGDMHLQNEPVVDVFSIKPSLYDMTVDVRFTVMSGNTYLSKTTVEGIIATYLSEFETAVSAPIKAVSIDMCQVTRCDNGCNTVHRADFVSFLEFFNNFNKSWLSFYFKQVQKHVLLTPIIGRCCCSCQSDCSCRSQCHFVRRLRLSSSDGGQCLLFRLLLQWRNLPRAQSWSRLWMPQKFAWIPLSRHNSLIYRCWRFCVVQDNACLHQVECLV